MKSKYNVGLETGEIRQQLRYLPLSAGETIIRWTDGQISFVSSHQKAHLSSSYIKRI